MSDSQFTVLAPYYIYQPDGAGQKMHVSRDPETRLKSHLSLCGQWVAKGTTAHEEYRKDDMCKKCMYAYQNDRKVLIATGRAQP